MWTYVGLASLAVVVCLLMWWLDPNLRRQRKYEAELKDREPLPDEEMMTRYFATDDGPSKVPAQVRRVFARHMEYPPDKLLPDDDLAFFWAELDTAELIEELESEFKITISQAEAEQTPCSIWAVSLMVARKTDFTRNRSMPSTALMLLHTSVRTKDPRR
jgi:hypothetical protein